MANNSDAMTNSDTIRQLFPYTVLLRAPETVDSFISRQMAESPEQALAFARADAQDAYDHYDYAARDFALVAIFEGVPSLVAIGDDCGAEWVAEDEALEAGDARLPAYRWPGEVQEVRVLEELPMDWSATQTVDFDSRRFWEHSEDSGRDGWKLEGGPQ